MEKRCFLRMLFISLTFLAACGVGSGSGDDLNTGSDCTEPVEEPHIVGLIYSKDERSMLVVEGIESVDIDQEEWDGNNAISFTMEEDAILVDGDGEKVDFDFFKKGDKVKVSHTGTLMESYPMQASAVRVELVEE
ncbi:DUF3221 domain-containing protein [Evansella sp. AB-rgal1]|uniref:DUF3221 domain-containing protein n=1 Tax=Evansella sp. AB-rgal1 TaxID=3242696 RepID=UPI00359CD771